VQWLIDQLFKACQRSPDSMAIVSAHLCGRLVCYPEVAGLYVDVLDRLLLYGSPDPPSVKALDLPAEVSACARLLFGSVVCSGFSVWPCMASLHS
jgi:hypothetical protein